MTEAADLLAAAHDTAAGGASLDEAIDRAAAGAVGAGTYLQLEGELRSQLRGAGPILQPLLDDDAVTDVLVNGATGVWADRGQGLRRVPTSGALATEDQVRALATRLAASCGRRLDDACPIVDGTLPGGTRLHAVIPPVAGEGTMISLRTFRRQTMSIADLVRTGAIAAALAPTVAALIERRANGLLSGATGTGKTTVLAALLGQAGAAERIICIEDSIELRPTHPHVIHLQVRRPNVQQVGDVTMSDLVRAAMRMRPDRIVLGECRGAEVRDVLGALNTGHEGGWATVHANTSADVPARLIALGALAGMSPQAMAAQAAAGLDVILHLRRDDGVRRLAEISVLARTGTDLTCQLAIGIDAGGTISPGLAWDGLASRLGAAAMPPITA